MLKIPFVIWLIDCGGVAAVCRSRWRGQQNGA
jgi:hypothetical protein